MKIRCDYDPKPIPMRQFDWTAIDVDIYDGAPDAGPQCVGYGTTRREAMESLFDQLYNRALEHDREDEFWRSAMACPELWRYRPACLDRKESDFS